MKITIRYLKIQIFVLIAAILLLIPACSIIEGNSGYQYRSLPQTGDGWQTASLDEVGIDTERISAFMNALSEYPDHWIHGVLVVKEGKLVFEEYFQGRDLDLSDLDGKLDFRTKDFDRDTLHSAASVSKSVTAVLFGIAIDQGLIAGTDETFFLSSLITSI